MKEEFVRTARLLGEEAIERLASSRVAVFGLGGVGGYAVEALARSGIGALDLIDADTVSRSNLNRQIFATQRTIGRYKTDVAAERVAEINPDCKVTLYRTFFLPETAGEIDFSRFDYAIDAIDTVAGKIEIALRAKAAGVPAISAMGAGNKLDPSAFEVADLSKTSVCPLARTMRRELKKRGIEHLKVVFSREEPVKPVLVEEGEENRNESAATEETERGRRAIPGSVAFVPSVAGLLLAAEVVKDLLSTPSKN